MLLLIIFASLGIAFVLYLLVLYLRTQVPYVATPTQRMNQLFDYLLAIRLASDIRFVDFGAGFGRVVFFAEQRGIRNAIGYELSPMHAYIARLLAFFRLSRARVYCADFLTADISQVNVIYMFLNDNAMKAVAHKLRQDAHPGTLVFVLGDVLPGFKPHDVIHTERADITVYLI